MIKQLKRISIKDFLIVFIPCMIWTILFWNSLVWDYSEFSRRKFVTYFGVFIFMLIIALCASLSNKFILYRIRIEEKIKILINDIKNNKFKYVKVIVIYVLLTMLALVLSYVSYQYNLFSDKSIKEIFLLYVLITWSVYTIYVCRNICEKNPEILFFFLSVILSSFFIFKCFNSFMSWDEQAHFENVIQIQRLFTGNDLQADRMYLESIGSFPDGIQEVYDARKTVPMDSQISFSEIAYIPYYVGLAFARGLGLSLKLVYQISVLFHAFFYSFIMSAAIKIVPYGKRILSCVGLSSTLLFIVGSYSYDSWVVAFIALGFSCYIKLLESEDYTLTLKDTIPALLFLLLGCLPKAVYFPLILIGLFIPKRKFKSKNEKRKFIVMIIAVVIFLIATFMLPMLFSSTAQAGDTRGGEDVSAIGQIKYILNNPIQYAKTLFNFLFTSFLPYESTAKAYLSFFAYIGQLETFTLPLLTIVVTAFLDRNTSNNNNYLFKFSAYISIFASIILVATALYVAFTDVGLNTINGCQPRYLIPLLYPFYLLLAPNFKNKVNLKYLSIVSVSLMTFHYFYLILKLVYL